MGDRTISIGFRFEDGADGMRNLIMNAEELRRVFSATVVQATTLNHSVINFAQLAKGLEAVKSSMGEISSVLTELTGDAQPFADAMQATNTMAGRDAAGLEALKVEVTELAQRVPVARDVLANGLYQVISNGVPEDNWISYLEASSRSAIGGIADLGQVVGVTSTLIKNYGLSWEQAGAIQDKIQLTAKNGVTSFEQLAASLPKVTANAATLGVSIDELMATFATLTGVSGNTAEVATQLAAGMTALVKPSSQAVKMAAEMGVQFDAAAIKAAGGFQQFLSSLDASIKAYAASSGVLEQEVYAKLFGSAEALRALIPLNGELASKFGSNVAEMKNSAGTMDAAFENMNKTSEAVTQRLKNNWGEVFDMLNSFVIPIKPYFDAAVVLVQFGVNVTVLIKAFDGLKLAMVQAAGVKIGAFFVGLTRYISSATVRAHGFSVAMRAAATSARGLSLAIGGLVSTAGVGLLIWGITEAVTLLTSRTKEARKAVDDLNASQKQSARTADELKSAEEAYSNSAAEGLGAINKEIASLKALIEAKQDTGEAIKRLNREYGSIFGTYATAEQWLDTLTRKSQIYAASLGFQGKLSELGKQQADYQVRRAQKQAQLDELLKSGKAYNKDANGQPLKFAFSSSFDKKIGEKYGYDASLSTTKETNRLVDELYRIDNALNELGGEIQTTAGLAAESAAELAKSLPAGKLGAGDNKKKPRVKTAEAPPPPEGSIKYKEEQIRTLKTRFEVEVDPEQRQKLTVDIDKLQREVDQMRHEAGQPTVLSTLEEIDREINYQRTLRQKATAENIAGIDTEIRKLEELRDRLESSAVVSTPIEEVKTYEQLNRELFNYEAMLEKANSSRRSSIQDSINRLKELKKSWDDALSELKKPGEVSALGTIEELEEAIAYYQQRQKKATGDEVSNIQRTIEAYRKKREALQRGIELPSMLQEAKKTDSLTGKEYKIKVSGMGFDTLTSKISELKRLLADLDNPVTAGQRKDIEKLIGIYERWRRDSVVTFDTLQSGWSRFKGIGDGLTGITSALKDNSDAWRSITGVVDGALQIYDGVRNIIDLIDMLRVATVAHTTAKTAESAAIGVAAGAQTADAVAAQTNAAAQLPVIAANKLVTASYMELAAASYFAAHASIPFAGFGIAAGFSTAAVSMVEAIGVTPFAEGGVVSGPTVGLIGEYPGASRNPEVVAPLSKLRGLLTDIVNGPGLPETDGGEVRIMSQLTETVRSLETVSRTVERSLERVSETVRSFEMVRQSVLVPVMTVAGAGFEAVAASVPHFAAGGVVYGPTLGVMGEYAGAGSNPEVVAPLDRLRGIITDSMGAGDVSPRNVTFTIEGSRLVGVLDNYIRVAGRSGRRFNFKG